MLKRFLKAEKQFRTVHSAYRNVDFRLVDSKPTDLANQKREIDLISKIKRRSKEIEEVERIKNELRPRAEAIFRLHDEVLPLTEDDFDEDGNLKPLPSHEHKQELYLGARRVLRTVPLFSASDMHASYIAFNIIYAFKKYLFGTLKVRDFEIHMNRSQKNFGKNFADR